MDSQGLTTNTNTNTGNAKKIAAKLFSKGLSFYQKQAKALNLGLEMTEVDDVTRNLRLAICESCDKLNWEGTCGLCLCDMNFKSTLKFMPFQMGVTEDQKELVACPLDKW